jgi:hypothetical protein
MLVGENMTALLFLLAYFTFRCNCGGGGQWSLFSSWPVVLWDLSFPINFRARSIFDLVCSMLYPPLVKGAYPSIVVHILFF